MANDQLALIPTTEAGRFLPHQQLSAWGTAKARFLEGLDPAERKLFNEATVENLFYSTSVAQSRDAKDSKVRAGFEKIKSLVAAIEEYGKALDVYAQIAPLYLSPIWGSIRVVLVLASVHSKFYGRMVEVLGKIGNLLPRLGDYEKLFDANEHPRFAEVLSKAYLDIIELCTDFKKMIEVQKVSRMKRVFQPLSTSRNLQLEDAVVRFEGHRKVVQKEADICHMIEEKKSRELVLRIKKEEDMRLQVYRQKDLVGQLSNLDHKYKHRRMQRLRHPGTGTWVLPTFQRWLDCTTSAILCCSGIPGSGKSILTSSLIDAANTFNHDHKSAVVYFYCDYADEGTLQPHKIFCNLTQQLLSMITPLPESLLNLVDELLRHGREMDVEDVMDLTLKVVKSFPSLILFLDGIDEMSEADRVLVVKLLWKIIDTGSTTIKIYVSGREDATRLTKAPEVNMSKIHINQESIAGDICNFVEHEVRSLIDSGDLIIGDQALLGEITTALSEGSKGMFLWVKFQLSDICASETDEAIRATLRNLPKDLSETYDRYLKKASHQADRRRELLKRLFNWLLCVRRPLTFAEVREAIAFTIRDNHFNGAKLPNDLHRLARASGNLIIIDEPTQNVQLAHYTVQQYLLRYPSSTRSFFCNSLEEAHVQIGYICLAYLSFSDFEQQVTPYHENRVTTNFTAIENIVNNRTMLPSKASGASAIKYVLRFREGRKATGIDFARHIASPNSTPEIAVRYENFALLPYIAENWLVHTSYIRSEQSHLAEGTLDLSIPDASIARHMLAVLVLTKTLPFQIWPCDTIALPRSEYQFAVQFGIAIKLDHKLLAAQLRPKLNDYRSDYPNDDWSSPDRLAKAISDHWLQISRWVHGFWEQQKVQYITKEIDHYLNLHHGGPVPTKDNWEGWTYYQIVNAVAKNKYESMQVLLSAWDINMPSTAMTGSPSSGAFFGHLLMEAVLNSRSGLVKVIGAKLQNWPGSLPKQFVEEALMSIEYKGLICNALEIARLSDYPVIGMFSALVTKFDVEPSVKFLNSLFATDKLQVAIRQRDRRHLSDYLWLMGFSPGSPASLAFEPSEYLRCQADTSNVITHCIQQMDDEVNKPYISNAFSWTCSKSYRKHWISHFSKLDPWIQIDMLLMCGGEPSGENGRYLLKNVFLEGYLGDPSQMRNIAQKLYLDDPLPLQAKRIKRLIAAGVKIGGIGSSLSIPHRLRVIYPLADFDILELPPVYFSILYCHQDITKLLINERALDLDPTASGLSPLHFAILKNSTDMFRLLLAHRVDFQMSDSEYWDVPSFAKKYVLSAYKDILREFLSILEEAPQLDMWHQLDKVVTR